MYFFLFFSKLIIFLNITISNFLRFPTEMILLQYNVKKARKPNDFKRRHLPIELFSGLRSLRQRQEVRPRLRIRPELGLFPEGEFLPPNFVLVVQHRERLRDDGPGFDQQPQIVGVHN